MTAATYFTSAGFAMFASKVPGTATHGQIRLHKFLAWISRARYEFSLPRWERWRLNRANQGEKVHGIASAHGIVAVTTGVAHGLAILSVSVKI